MICYTSRLAPNKHLKPGRTRPPRANRLTRRPAACPPPPGTGRSGFDRSLARLSCVL